MTNTSDFLPIGMAFCIDKKFAVTAYHNLIKSDTNGHLYPRLAFCKSVLDGTITSSCMEVVTTGHFDVKDDWILLSPKSATDSFPNIVELAKANQLPSVDDFRNKTVRVVNAPIGMYIRFGGSLEISCETFKMISSYRPDIPDLSKKRSIGVKTLTVSSSFILPRDDPQCVWITVQDGLHSGACGSPYFDCYHRVVAMHIYSANEASSLTEVVSNHLAKRKQESTEAHCDIKEGLVLCKVSSFVRTIRKLLNIDINSKIVL